MEEFKYLIPEESTDAASLDATKLRSIESQLRSLFQSHGYEEPMLPTFEYANLYQEIRNDNEENMFEFVNGEGKLITLRADFTVPIARLYNNAHTSATRRYSYFGKVYRIQERHKGRSSELYQGGMELLGKGGYEGDAECLALVEASMKSIGITNPKLELGHAKFFHRLETLVQDDRLRYILDKKANSRMKSFVEEKGFTGSLKELLLKLPYSFGDIEDLKKMKDIIDDDILLEAIDEMIAMYDISTMKEDMVFDLCMVPTQNYYTGIMIKGYSYYSAYAILSGGRYDKLLSYFDKEVPAIGFSYHLNTLLEALSKEDEAND